jgi:hypothetical protein
VLQCRKHPELLAWCEFLQLLVDRARTLVELSRRYGDEVSDDKKHKTASKLSRCCRAIVDEVQRSKRLDRPLLLEAQSRKRIRRSKLGDLCGMDAAVHVGLWLVRGFTDISVDATPKPLRWTTRTQSTEVDVERLRTRPQQIAAWVANELAPRLLDAINSAFREDLAWLCRRFDRRVGTELVVASGQLASGAHAPGGYEQERARLFASTNTKIQESLNKVFTRERHIKEQCCTILEAMSTKSALSQKQIATALSVHGNSVSRQDVGYRLRAMKELGIVSGERKYRRSRLGTLMMKHCPDRAG